MFAEEEPLPHFEPGPEGKKARLERIAAELEEAETQLRAIAHFLEGYPSATRVLAMMEAHSKYVKKQLLAEGDAETLSSAEHIKKPEEIPAGKDLTINNKEEIGPAIDRLKELLGDITPELFTEDKLSAEVLRAAIKKIRAARFRVLYQKDGERRLSVLETMEAHTQKNAERILGDPGSAL